MPGVPDGCRVKVVPSVVNVVGTETKGIVAVSPSGSVVVKPPPSSFEVMELPDGCRVKVCPSVVSVAGEETEGIVIWSPLERVSVSDPPEPEVLGVVAVGEVGCGDSESVSPSVVSVVRDETAGIVIIPPLGNVRVNSDAELGLDPSVLLSNVVADVWVSIVEGDVAMLLIVVEDPDESMLVPVPELKLDSVEVVDCVPGPELDAQEELPG